VASGGRRQRQVCGVGAVAVVPSPGVTKVRKPAPRTEGLDSLTLTLHGAPRTKKTSNQLQRFGGRLKVVPSEAWMEWRDRVKASVDVEPWMRLKDQPYNCTALFYRDASRGDAIGFYTGLADVLEELGVVSNDRWIVSWDGSRLLVDKEHPRVQLTLTPIHESGDEI
jgi:hypothetical protein